MQPNVTLLPACYDAQRKAALDVAILHVHAIIAQAPDAESKLLAARDAAGHLAALVLSMAERAKAMGDLRAAAAIPHALEMLHAVVAIRALFETEPPVTREAA